MPRLGRVATRCGAVGFGLLVDRVVGEPPTQVHPVAWFGSCMGLVEERLWADRRTAGAIYTCAGVAIAATAGVLVRSTTLTVAISVAGNALRCTAQEVAVIVQSDDLVRARHELRALVGRDASLLDASGISAAVIESVAENSVDAVIAPVMWGLIAGAPGALVYRAINTMDAMVGHRSERFRKFGTVSARLDDVANYVPARAFAALVTLAKPGRRSAILQTIRRDAPAHPSPNAGIAESAVAAALTLELGGPLRYGDRVEERPSLGFGPRPAPGDVEAAVALANRVEWIVVGALGAIAVVGGLRRQR